MYFASDNWAGAHPAIAEALSSHAPGFAAAYGDSTLDASLHARFAEVFALNPHEISVFFVATGTAANALALTSTSRPGGVVFAHAEAHVLEDECGAVEYLSGQLRICGVSGKDGKIDPAELDRKIRRYADVHGGRPSSVTITQATECGTVYSLDEIDGVARAARAHGLPLHMDGARFANALVSLGAEPADMTWRRGVDMLSFGGTKNGCWCAEAVVFFHPSADRLPQHQGGGGNADADTATATNGAAFPAGSARAGAAAEEFMYVRKRAAQLFSKTRFVSAQFERYLRDGLWLELARGSNGMAQGLADAFEEAGAKTKADGIKRARLVRRPQSNEVFAVLGKDVAARARAGGFHFYDWPVGPDVEVGEDEVLCRFVTSFATTEEHVCSLRALICA